MIVKAGKSVGHMVALKADFRREVERERARASAMRFGERHRASMVTVDCPACVAPHGESTPWAEIFGFQYTRCSTCRLVYLNPHPTAASLLDFYSGGEFTHYVAGVASEPERLRLRLEQVVTPRIDFVLSFGPASRWLDLGAGTGDVVHGLRRFGVSALGVEPNSAAVAVAAAQYGLELVNADLMAYVRQAHLADFDVVSLFGVLEHLARPDALMEVLGRGMRPGALAVFLVPVADSMSSFLQKRHPELLARHAIPPAHVTLWGLTAMQALLRRFGFEVAGHWSYGQDAFELYYDLLPALEEPERVSLLSGMQTLQDAFDRMGFSDELLVVARKRGEESEGDDHPEDGQRDAPQT
jgi:2-polyprenyl-3-methyl-5-hydroxy-6-metoxy-1,4-benzoquinol methylase